ncbi:MAG TPA: polyprenyl diphosphate synthase [Steroidobacteraceae bacterium]|nr:polyprenyl diphosphate synthase [Steroidobacteraceae bacterium]
MHIGIIMDGNGRWATRRGLPRSAGHRAGAKAVDRVVEAAVRSEVAVLTLYAFAAANWARPRAEVNGLFALFRRYLQAQTARCLEQSVRINVIGRRDRLDGELVEAIEHSEWATSRCAGMLLRIAVDYSAQSSIVGTCHRLRSTDSPDRAAFVSAMAVANHASVVVPDVDLLIRTGGEQRLSDFLLWELAYAELYFTDCMWPDFDRSSFDAALQEFATRQRRFGQVPEQIEVRHA